MKAPINGPLQSHSIVAPVQDQTCRDRYGSLDVEINDKDLIQMGDVLHHPAPLTGEPSVPSWEGVGGSRPPPQAQYVMGHDDRERRRLALQASILNPFTEQLLRRAGISSGMRVLDLGCGIGEVSLMAARLVGRHGAVTAIDIDQAALAIAADRAREQALGNLKFVQGSIDQYEPGRAFDAVIGRHILIHLPDPLAILRKAFECLSPAGVVVFQEYDFSTVHSAHPPCPAFARGMAVFRDFFGATGRGNIGTQLLHLMLKAGFRAPDCRAEYPVDGGPDSPIYEWLAESFRSIAPRAAAAGVVKESELDLDALEEQLRQEAVSRNASIPGPTMVGCFARKP
jgi:SAM-dependent methyltransferase